MILRQVFVCTAIQAVAWIAGPAAQAQQVFTISGQLARDRQGWVRLDYNSREGEYRRDSAAVKDGVFTLTGKVWQPGMAQLMLNPSDKGMTEEYYRNLDQQSFYLEGADYVLKSDAGCKAAFIKGGAAQKEYTELKALHGPVDEKMAELSAMVAKVKSGGSDSGMDHLKELARPLVIRSHAIDSAYIHDHPDSYVAFDLFRKQVRGFIEPAVLEAPFLHFSERVRHSEEGAKLADRIVRAKRLGPGQPAIDFSLRDTSGQTVSLSSLKGKYVLVCFWQAGSYGLESQLMSMNRVNRLFTDKGLTIVAVSCDKDLKKWAAALRENKMNWINVSAVSTVEKDYDLSYNNIPQCLLVGPDGKILTSRLSLNNELPSVIGKYLGAAAGGPDGESDVYLGGDMTTYPPVDWIKGAPVAAFDKDRIYIVELWATWCVPCVAAMPHLEALSRKFGDRITVIGQDVMEEDKAKVEKFVEHKGDRLTYRIAYAGGRGSAFDKQWIMPAGVTGIPQTFVIQNNKLVWQTHPDKLNEAVLQLLVDKKFTIEAAEALSEKN